MNACSLRKVSSVQKVRNNMTSPFFSIVIPFYNAEKYFGECLESIESQTFGNFEVICVDDASTDRSSEVAARYLSDKCRVYKCAERIGAGAARNIGLKEAKGDYILFLDADDYFEATLLEKMAQAVSVYEPDLILYAGRIYDEKCNAVNPRVKYLEFDLLPEPECFSASDVEASIFQITNPAPWTKCFKRTFIERSGLEFQALPNSNDLFFSYAALSSASSIAAIKEPLVNYRTNSGDSTQDGKSKEPLCFVEALSSLRAYLKERGELDRFRSSFVCEALSILKYNIETNRSQEAKRKILGAVSSSNLFDEILEEAEKLGPEYPRAPKTLEYIKAALGQLSTEQRMTAAPPAIEQIKLSNLKEEPSVSVIVPVYNCGAYVEECLSSVLSQTYSSFEIICVDDGSTDDSLQILKRIADKDERVSVYHQPNSGLSVSRNNGLKVAVGKYVLFLDSDDMYDERALEVLVPRMDALALDVLLFDAKPFYESEELAKKHASYVEYYSRSSSLEGVCSGVDLVGNLAERDEYLPSACFYMVRRDLLSSISFIPGILHEDNAFTFEVMLNARRADRVSEMLYYRRVRQGSVMTSKKTFANSYGYFTCYNAMKRVFEKADIDNPDTQQEVGKICFKVLEDARTSYSKMSSEQQGGCQALSAKELYSFYYLVAVPALRMIEVARLKGTVKKKDKTIGELRSKESRRFLTRLKRKLKRVFVRNRNNDKI